MAAGEEVTLEAVRRVLPERRPDAHKGDHGRVVVVGGSVRYVGAPALAALAALRTGSDLAIVAAPEKTAWAINALSPDLITVKLPCENLEPGSVDEILEEAARSNAMVVGPGLGNDKKTLEAVGLLLQDIRRSYPRLPLVIDADALRTFPPEISRGMPWVLTPHAGELAEMTGHAPPSVLDERIKSAEMASRKFGCVVLLKGRIDVISSPDGGRMLNRTGNPGMTVGGTGDVLSGIVGSLLGQGVGPFEAAWAGALICGRAGDLCMREKGYEFIASDLLDKIPEVFGEIRRKRRGKVRGR
ncbi:MAG: NAD(P)H-hydrate dehydratase [Candidatus Hadarchaeales archaeon]